MSRFAFWGLGCFLGLDCTCFFGLRLRCFFSASLCFMVLGFGLYLLFGVWCNVIFLALIIFCRCKGYFYTKKPNESDQMTVSVPPHPHPKIPDIDLGLSFRKGNQRWGRIERVLLGEFLDIKKNKFTKCP